MRALEQYIQQNNRGKIGRLLRRASMAKMDARHTDTHSHRTCLAMRDICFTRRLKKDVTLLQSCLNLREILPQTAARETISDAILADLECGRYDLEGGEQIHQQEYLHLNIKAYVEQRKIIFIMFGFMDYFVDTFLDGNGHLAHSVCAILIPYKDHYATLGRQQIDNILITLRFIQNKERKGKKLQQIKNANIQKCIQWCIKNKIPYNKLGYTGNIFLSESSKKYKL